MCVSKIYRLENGKSFVPNTTIPTDKIIPDVFSKLFFDKKKKVITVIIIIERASIKNRGK